MKNFAVFLVCLVAFRAQAQSLTFPATMDAQSTQAVLMNVLESVKSFAPEAVSEYSDSTRVSIEVSDDKAKVTCSELSPVAPDGLSGPQVQSFECVFDNPRRIEEITSAADSVQALLVEALRKRFELQKRALLGPGSLMVESVSTPNGRGYTLDDGVSSITCLEHSPADLGLLIMIQHYSCKISLN